MSDLFQNTATGLKDCWDDWYNKRLSAEEREAKKEIIELAKQIVTREGWE